MSQVRVACFSISADGYGAGPQQSLQAPLGIGGERLHDWGFGTASLRQMLGFGEGGSQGVDDRHIRDGFDQVGAWILGRHMFGPQRGPWPDDGWQGWWGEEPPYHCPVFVLTHHARPPLTMQGGTVFHFVEGLENALQQARAAANGRDVRIGGGTATLRQGLQAGLIDRLHIAIAPVLLGGGESLFGGLDLPALGYRVARHEQGEGALHLHLERSSPCGIT